MSKHFKISMIKSCVRILGCVLGILFHSVIVLGIALIAAEVIGIIEEVHEDD